MKEKLTRLTFAIPTIHLNWYTSKINLVGALRYITNPFCDFSTGRPNFNAPKNFKRALIGQCVKSLTNLSNTNQTKINKEDLARIGFYSHSLVWTSG